MHFMHGCRHISRKAVTATCAGTNVARITYCIKTYWYTSFITVGDQEDAQEFNAYSTHQ